jgi:hypothetical protein
MIDIQKAMKSNRLMKALTGLKIKQFKILAVNFNVHLEKTFKKYRKVNLHQGRGFKLKSSQEKLFYILFYAKVYPSFDVAGFIFNADKSSCCRWAHWFIKALELALGQKCVLPKRKAKDLEKIFLKIPQIKEIFIDGTERPIRRPKNQEKQKDNYSGKKKRHTKKNLIISTKKKEIIFLSKTMAGRTHDYKGFKDENLAKRIFEYIRVYFDNGFQGVEKDFPDLLVKMPKKKPRGRDLSQSEKNRNKSISSKRILAEHAISGIKRLNIVSQIYRNTKDGFDDQVMMIACGIWNFYLSK